MKIYSWNLYCYNKKPEEVKQFIESLDYDVLCLQEVSEELLGNLKQNFSNLACAIDHARVDGDALEECYLVIISKRPIVKSGFFMVSEFPRQPLRTRIFVKMMRPFNWVEKIINHHALFVDIDMSDPTGRVRIFSVHLRHEGPTERIKELSIISENLDKNHPNIVCGDFNTIYRPWFNIFNWIMGSPLSEGLPWFSETKIMNKCFRGLSLKNPLEKQFTHKLIRDQLDHILTPQGWAVKRAGVIRELHGSDHYPIFVEVERRTK